MQVQKAGLTRATNLILKSFRHLMRDAHLKQTRTPHLTKPTRTIVIMEKIAFTHSDEAIVRMGQDLFEVLLLALRRYLGVAGQVLGAHGGLVAPRLGRGPQLGRDVPAAALAPAPEEERESEHVVSQLHRIFSKHLTKTEESFSYMGISPQTMTSAWPQVGSS
jgi:hypothetical protein